MEETDSQLEETIMGMGYWGRIYFLGNIYKIEIV